MLRTPGPKVSLWSKIRLSLASIYFLKISDESLMPSLDLLTAWIEGRLLSLSADEVDSMNLKLTRLLVFADLYSIAFLFIMFSF